MRLNAKKANQLLNSQGDRVVIPEGYTYIESGVFRDSGITEVVLPEGLRIIDNYAFSWSKLKEVTFPHSLEHIGENAFRANELEVVNFGNGLKYPIGNGAFAENRLKAIHFPHNVGFQRYAFSDNPLEEVFYVAGRQKLSSIRMLPGNPKRIIQKSQITRDIKNLEYGNEIIMYFGGRIGIRPAHSSVKDLAIVGTDASDNIIGSSENEFILGGKGKNILRGVSGYDGFVFDSTTDFGRKKSDVITDFKAIPGGYGKGGDEIFLCSEHFDQKPL